MVLNLALNARDAMPRGGVLKFESRIHELESPDPVGLGFEFVVRDTGLGMDEQTAARAFDPFFTAKAAGRGTGLATVRSFVEAARGAICTETSPGKGTRMIVRLPLLPRDTRENQAAGPNGRSTSKQLTDRGDTA